MHKDILHVGSNMQEDIFARRVKYAQGNIFAKRVTFALKHFSTEDLFCTRVKK